MEDETPTAKFLRLQTGEDIICELVEITNDDEMMYMIINPLKIVYVPSSKSGYVQVAMMPWVFPHVVDHQEFTLSPNDVIIMSDASEKLNTYYWNNLDQLGVSDIENEETVEETTEPEDHLQEVLNKITSMRRTYH